jgi:hypothetical protein
LVLKEVPEQEEIRDHLQSEHKVLQGQQVHKVTHQLVLKEEPEQEVHKDHHQQDHKVLLELQVLKVMHQLGQ